MSMYNFTNKHPVLLFLTFATLLIAGCGMDYSNSMLSVENKSNRSISVLHNNGELKDEMNLVAYYLSDVNIIKPDSSKIIFHPGDENTWHRYIQKGKQRKLFIYVFEEDSLRKYSSTAPISNILEAHQYLQKIEFSEEQLRKLHWKIIFTY